MSGLLRGLARVAPFAIIAALIGSVFLVRLDPTVTQVDPPAHHPRDRFVAIEAPAPDILWMASLEGKIVRSDDGGSTWHIQRPAGTSALQDMVAWTSGDAVAVGADGLILKTTDGGATWTPQTFPLETKVRLLHVGQSPDGRLWITGERNTLLVSDDGGRTFSPRADWRDVGINDVAFATPETGWLVAEFGELRHTADGGATWQDTPPADASLLATDACDASGLGVAVGLQGRVLITQNAGASWTALPPTGPDHLFDVTCHGQDFIAVGDRGAIVRGNARTQTTEPVAIAGAPTVWRTAVRKEGNRLLLAGAASGIVADDRYHPIAR